MVVNIGDLVCTSHGHVGKVVKRYRVTGVSTMYVHIQEPDGRIWYCPESDIVAVKRTVLEAAKPTNVMDEILRLANSVESLRWRHSP